MSPRTLGDIYALVLPSSECHQQSWQEGGRGGGEGRRGGGEEGGGEEGEEGRRIEGRYM